jgi:hypothetical protein
MRDSESLALPLGYTPIFIFFRKLSEPYKQPILAVLHRQSIAKAYGFFNRV